MGRELKRVPLDFDWPRGEVWKGYDSDMAPCWMCDGGLKSDFYTTCPECDGEGTVRVDPLTGPGYQLWETTSAGSPISPVFTTLEALCEWAADNATTFAEFRASAEAWKEMLTRDFIYHREGNIIFI